MQLKVSPIVRRIIGGRIMENREKLRLGSSELARYLGVPRSSVTDWERGRWLPNLVIFWALSQKLEVPIEKLLGPVDGWRFRPEGPPTTSSPPEAGRGG